MFTPITTIKGWFRTRAKPTQAQFYALFDSFFHKGETLPVAAVDQAELLSFVDARIQQAAGPGGGDGPTESIYTPVSVSVSDPATYLMQAEHLVKGFIILPTLPGNLKIGTSPNGAELFEYDAPDTAVVFAEISIFQLNAFTLYFTGDFEVRFIITDYANS